MLLTRWLSPCACRGQPKSDTFFKQRSKGSGTQEVLRLLNEKPETICISFQVSPLRDRLEWVCLWVGRVGALSNNCFLLIFFLGFLKIWKPWSLTLQLIYGQYMKLQTTVNSSEVGHLGHQTKEVESAKKLNVHSLLVW